jgi:hypothetical protein
MIVAPQATVQNLEPTTGPLAPAPDLPYLKRFKGRTSSPPEEEPSLPLAVERPRLSPLRLVLAAIAAVALLAYALVLYWTSRDKLAAWFAPKAAQIEAPQGQPETSKARSSN